MHEADRYVDTLYLSIYLSRYVLSIGLRRDGPSALCTRLGASDDNDYLSMYMTAPAAIGWKRKERHCPGGKFVCYLWVRMFAMYVFMSERPPLAPPPHVAGGGGTGGRGGGGGGGARQKKKEIFFFFFFFFLHSPPRK